MPHLLCEFIVAKQSDFVINEKNHHLIDAGKGIHKLMLDWKMLKWMLTQNSSRFVCQPNRVSMRNWKKKLIDLVSFIDTLAWYT